MIHSAWLDTELLCVWTSLLTVLYSIDVLGRGFQQSWVGKTGDNQARVRNLLVEHHQQERYSMLATVSFEYTQKATIEIHSACQDFFAPRLDIEVVDWYSLALGWLLLLLWYVEARSSVGHACYMHFVIQRVDFVIGINQLA